MSFFKKLFGGDKAKPESTAPGERPEIPADPSLLADPNIRLHLVEHGRHGDHHGAMFGFENLQAGEGGELINQMVDMAYEKANGQENESGLRLTKIPFSEVDTSCTPEAGVTVLTMEEQMISAFPYLTPKRTLPFRTKDIYRWQNINNLEADIAGNGRDTFGLGFYATNWVDRQNDFYAAPEIEVRVSALILVLQDFMPPQPEEGQPEFAPDFCGYFPNQDLPGKTYYDFISYIRSIRPAIIPGGTGYFLELQLINQEEDPDFFVVEAFVNAQNVQMEEVPKIGDQVTGALWFQGEIV